MWIAILLMASALFAVLVAAIPSAKREGSAGFSRRPAESRATARQVYSPAIATDPYVVEQWEKSIEALEKACRDGAQYCDEARQARLSVNR